MNHQIRRRAMSFEAVHAKHRARIAWASTRVRTGLQRLTASGAAAVVCIQMAWHVCAKTGGNCESGRTLCETNPCPPY